MASGSYVPLLFRWGLLFSPQCRLHVLLHLHCSHELNISYAGSNIMDSEESFANTSPIISFGLGRFTHVPWIVFTNYSQELMHGIYPVLLFYTEQKKIVLSYGKLKRFW